MTNPSYSDDAKLHADMLLSTALDRVNGSGPLPPDLQIAWRLGHGITCLSVACALRLNSLPELCEDDRTDAIIKGFGGAVGLLMAPLAPVDRRNLLSAIMWAVFDFLEYRDPPELNQAWRALMDRES